MTHPWDVLNRSCKRKAGRETRRCTVWVEKDQRDREVKDSRQRKRDCSGLGGSLLLFTAKWHIRVNTFVIFVFVSQD